MAERGLVLKLIALTAIFILLTGCSLYESDGRKYLEAGGITFYNKTKPASAFVSCSTEAPSAAWVPFEKNDLGQFSSSESENFEILVTPVSTTPYNCLFRFASAQEMFENTSGAMDYCLHQSPVGCQR
jgi:hypothetical protein